MPAFFYKKLPYVTNRSICFFNLTPLLHVLYICPKTKTNHSRGRYNEINKEVTEGKTMNHASVGLFNAVLMSVPVWTMIYFGIRLLAG
jgi:hypothetical protein